MSLLEYFARFNAGRAEVGPIETRGDLTGLFFLLSVASKKLAPNLVNLVLVLGWMVREPKFIQCFARRIEATHFDGTDLFNTWLIFGCFRGLVRLEGKVRRKYNPARIFNNFGRPSNILAHWKPCELLRIANKVTGAFAGTVGVAEHELIAKQMKLLHGVGTYGSEHAFRTLCLLHNRPFPGTEFVLMGSGANKKVYDRIRALGIQNVTEFNKHLTVPVDAGLLAFYVCMCKM